MPLVPPGAGPQGWVPPPPGGRGGPLHIRPQWRGGRGPPPRGGPGFQVNICRLRYPKRLKDVMPCFVIHKTHAVRTLPTPSILYRYWKHLRCVCRGTDRGAEGLHPAGDLAGRRGVHQAGMDSHPRHLLLVSNDASYGTESQILLLHLAWEHIAAGLQQIAPGLHACSSWLLP